MKIRNTIYVIAAAMLAACAADNDAMQLSPQQQELLGQGVNFSTSMVSLFVTRTTYHADGSFNEGDQMRIFRQYATDATGTSFDEKNEIYRTYYLNANYAAGTSAAINSDWIPMAGKLKYDGPGTEPKDQNAGDSLTWENGSTVRFRAWGRSNLSGAISSTSEGYYPDYTVSDWVTVSGPTQNIPLTMRHIACRIALTPKAGNQFSSVELCTEEADYATSAEKDSVVATLNKMCLPAGVDDKTFQLTAMTQDRYNAGNLQNIEKSNEGIVKIGTMSVTEIAEQVQHPDFKNNNGNQYLMSIPVDMSKENTGADLVLPACTRFKVWLYYVNGTNGKREAACHVFKLSDIKKDSDKPAFPNGITLKAGYSYTFSVGYQYNKFSITASNDFSWDNMPLGNQDADKNEVGQGTLDYNWFTSALKAAAQAANEKAEAAKTDQTINVNYQPVFEIDTPEKFLSFTHLVNGTFIKPTPALTRGELRTNEGLVNTYWWIVEGETDENGEPVKLTREEAEARGYLFYYQFHQSVSTQGAYINEELLVGPYDFYDTQNKTKFEVCLTANLDLNDWVLPSIGIDSKKPFRSVFNGYGHTLKNVNMASGYLFDNVTDAAITNLSIESVHNTCLLHSGVASGDTGWGCYIAGVSMLCPTATNAIAQSLVGNSYVVGCLHVGSHVGATGGALVGTASNLTMLGCMQTANGIEKNTGALLGNYASSTQFFAPQAAGKLKWGSFMCNYYDVEQSPATHAVGSIADAYLPQQYIRGSKSHILKAKNDYMIGSGMKYSELTPYMKQEMYGLAPWRAMNYAIWMYNSSTEGKRYPCSMWYRTSDVGYTHLYPTMYSSTTAPDNVSSWNPLAQNN